MRIHKFISIEIPILFHSQKFQYQKVFLTKTVSGTRKSGPLKR